MYTYTPVFWKKLNSNVCNLYLCRRWVVLYWDTPKILSSILWHFSLCTLMYHTFLSFFHLSWALDAIWNFPLFYLAGISRRIFIRFATGIVFIVWKSHGPTDFFSPLRHISLLHIGRLTKAYVRYFFCSPLILISFLHVSRYVVFFYVLLAPSFFG